MTDRSELITIGILCFNAEGTIERAVESALSQDWNALEILIVDDASTDASLKIIGRLAKQHPEIRVIEHGRNRGPAAGRNTVLAEARGEFVAFFDDDDVSYPERVRTQAETIRNYEEQNSTDLVICSASGERLYGNGYRLELPAVGTRGRPPIGSELADYLLYFERHPGCDYGGAVAACSLMARRDVMKRGGGFDPSLRRVEDNDLGISMALAGAHFIGTKQVLYTQYSTSAPDKSPEKNLEAELYLAEKYQDYLRSKGLYFYAKMWPLLRYNHFRRRYWRLFLVLAAIVVRHPIRAVGHFAYTAPRRLLHERRMVSC